jgi:hypothetical protein
MRGKVPQAVDFGFDLLGNFPPHLRQGLRRLVVGLPQQPCFFLLRLFQGRQPSLLRLLPGLRKLFVEDLLLLDNLRLQIPAALLGTFPARLPLIQNRLQRTIQQPLQYDDQQNEIARL